MGSKVHHSSRASRDSRYSRPPPPGGMESLVGKRLEVMVGRLNIMSIPWTFHVKLSGQQTEQPPIKCQLENAAHLPVTTLFEDINEKQNGRFIMIILRLMPGRIHLVKLSLYSNGEDVAQYLANKHSNMQKNLAAKLPQYNQFFNFADTQESPKAPNEATGQGRPRALRVPHKTAPVSSSSSEDNYGKQIFYGKDNNTFTSHSPIYSKSLLQSYISNQRKPAQHVTGVPEMKCDPQLKPPQMKKKDAGFVLLHDNASSISASTQRFRQELTGDKSQTPCNFAASASSNSSAPASRTPYTQHTNAKLCRFSYNKPEHHLVVGSVTHVVSIDQFYMVPQSSSLVSLEERLQLKYKNKDLIELPTKWRNAAFAVEVDGWWLRAEITFVGHTKSDNLNASRSPRYTIEVFLVDSGRTGPVPMRAIRVLEKEDAALPAQAICCSLRGVWKKQWSPEEIALLQGVGTIEALFVSSISKRKFSTIITKGDGSVINCLLGSESYEILKYQKLRIDKLTLEEDDYYEVKIVGPWRKQIFVQIKGREGDLKEIEEQLKSNASGDRSTYFPRRGDYVHVFENPYHKRGYVAEVTRTSVLVDFVDFGVTKNVGPEAIQLLPEHYLMKPAMALQCFVADFERPWPRDQTFVKVKVVGYEEDCPVLMLTEQEQPPLTIATATTFSKPLGDSKLAAAFPIQPHQLPTSPTKTNGSSANPDLQLATISYVQSSSMYFVRLTAKEAKYAQLEAEIAKKPLQLEEDRLKEGDVCLAQFKGHWARAEVLPGGQCLFFDYGSRGPLEKAMHLQQHLRDIESAAILCWASPDLQGLAVGVSVQVQLSGNSNKIVGLASEMIIPTLYKARETSVQTRKSALIGNYEPPWRIWLIFEPDILEELGDRLNQTASKEITASPKMNEVYACKTEEGWFRGHIECVSPPAAFLIDVGRLESNILEIKPLTGLTKCLQPLAKPFDIFMGDVSSSVDVKLTKLLAPGTTVETQSNTPFCVFWVHGENVLEASGHMVRVEVSHRELDGSIWLTRMSKALRRTEKLQPVAPGLEALDEVYVGRLCVAREMSDNRWYRAALISHTRLFHTVRLVDFGRCGEAVELKKWWSKEAIEANRYNMLKVPAEVGNKFLVVKKEWRDGKAAVYDNKLDRVDIT